MRKLGVVGVFSLGAMFGHCAVEQNEKPNVLLILTDDQGYGDLSLYGNPYVSTPNLDRFGTESVQFDRFYVNSVCAPSRASILTGRYAVRTGVHSVTRNRETIKASEVTIGEALQANGYRTGYIGKWHNGAQYPNIPSGQGFDEFFGFTAGHINTYFDAVLQRGGTPEKTSGYITDVLTDEAVRFMKGNAATHKSPFFLHLSYNAPHGPYQVPDEYYDRFEGKGLSVSAAGTWAMCENIDDNVGRLLACLDELGISENTIVLFLTDNGGIGGAKVYNAGMRGWKTSTHEGGSRVPLFMRWPRAGWVPHHVEQLAAHIDLYPTLMELCGATPPPGPPVDGVSLRPLLENAGADWPERTLFTHNGIDENNRYPGAVRTPRYRLVCTIPGPNAGSAAVNRDAEVRPWELYDMKNDPGEEKDLASSLPEVVAALSRQYETWVDDIFSEGLSRMPLPVGYDEQNPVSLHASQAYFSSPVRYQSGRGFAHDWLTGWTNTQGRVWFDVDVVRSGTYEVAVELGCPEKDAGSVLSVRAGESKAESLVPAAPAPDVDLPHRDEFSKLNYREREWTLLPVGSIYLEKGAAEISMEALSMPGSHVMDFKRLILKRVAP